jgi:hypothetical protein
MPPTSCWFLTWIRLRPLIWKRYVLPKRQLTFTGLHDVTSLKTELFMQCIICTPIIYIKISYVKIMFAIFNFYSKDFTVTERKLLKFDGLLLEGARSGADHSGMNRLRTLEHWDRGFESHLIHGCLCAFILCLCCSMSNQRPCDGLISHPRNLTDCV